MEMMPQGTFGRIYPEGFRDVSEGGTPARTERRRTLLVVEDNEDTADMLRLWLELDGYEVVVAGSGWEAVQLALRGRYDAILMDMSLPIMDGMSALRLIRAHEGLRHVPVVAMTAYDAAYPRVEAMEAACDEYMVKPFDFRRLEIVLQRVIH